MSEKIQVQRTDDLIQPFQIDSMSAQGRLVRLGAAVDAILSAHEYPERVAELLGEGLALAALIAGSFKFDGVMTLQVNGNGPVPILVADITSDGGMRGYARFDPERLADNPSTGGPTGPVPALLGFGHMAFTIDQGLDTQRHQTIVALEGLTLADCAHDYLRRSVQIEGAVKLAAGRTAEAGCWRAAGLLVQRAPSDRRQRLSGEAALPEDEDSWRRAVALIGSAKAAELLNPALHPHRLLYQLFHEDGVRVFDNTALDMNCRCSWEQGGQCTGLVLQGGNRNHEGRRPRKRDLRILRRRICLR